MLTTTVFMTVVFTSNTNGEDGKEQLVFLPRMLERQLDHKLRE
jgi:hypothetical protein